MIMTMIRLYLCTFTVFVITPLYCAAWRVILRFIAVLTQFHVQTYNVQMMTAFDAIKE